MGESSAERFPDAVKTTLFQTVSSACFGSDSQPTCRHASENVPADCLYGFLKAWSGHHGSKCMCSFTVSYKDVGTIEEERKKEKLHR